MPRDWCQAAGEVQYELLEQYIHAAIAPNTRLAYQKDLRRFIEWGGNVPLTPDEVARHVAYHAATHKRATLLRWVASLGKAHRALGLLDPTKTEMVRAVISGVSRTHVARQRQVNPVLRAELVSMLGATGAGLKGARDRAPLLLGFAGARRRSEIVAVDVEDVQCVLEGIALTVTRSKTDQYGEGRTLGIPHARGLYCPVRAVIEWRTRAGLSTGPLFRPVTRHGKVIERRVSSNAVATLVKEYAGRVGLDAHAYSGHSLRSGLATSAVSAGIPVTKIQAQTGHKSLGAFNRYVRDTQMFVDNAAGGSPTVTTTMSGDGGDVDMTADAGSPGPVGVGDGDVLGGLYTVHGEG